jgi:hypothetical protein
VDAKFDLGHFSQRCILLFVWPQGLEKVLHDLKHFCLQKLNMAFKNADVDVAFEKIAKNVYKNISDKSL